MQEWAVYTMPVFSCEEHEKVVQGLRLSVFLSHTCPRSLGTAQRLQDESANGAVNCPQLLQVPLSYSIVQYRAFSRCPWLGPGHACASYLTQPY